MDVGHGGGDQGLVEDGGDLVLAGLLLDLGESGPVTARRPGDRPLIAIWVEVVAAGQVAEGGVGGDELRPRAVGQALAELLVEGAQLSRSAARRWRRSRPAGPDRSRPAGGRPRSRWCPAGWGPARRADPARRARHRRRPPRRHAHDHDRRGRPAVCSGDDGRGVQGVVHPALSDRLVDRGLEGLLVDHQVGRRELGDLTRGQLQVVRLGARLRSGC